MSKDALIAPLMRVALFQGLKPLQITEIARNAERIVFRAGETITELGAEGDAAFLIVSGSAVCLGAADRDAVEPGSLIGEMAMLIEHAYGSRVVAQGNVRALRLTRSALHEQMLADPTLAQHLMTRIVERLNAVADELKRIDGVFGERPPVAALAAPAQGVGSRLTH